MLATRSGSSAPANGSNQGDFTSRVLLLFESNPEESHGSIATGLLAETVPAGWSIWRGQSKSVVGESEEKCCPG